MFDVNNIEYKNHNERDVEVPAFLEFLKERPDIKSLLDVGACYSYYAYARAVADALDELARYDGIDILACDQTAKIVDAFYVDNFCSAPLNEYDAISCISTVEHSGITSYKVSDHKAEQAAVLARIFNLAKKHFYVSFPFGAEGIYPNEYSNITEDQLSGFEKVARDAGFSTEAKFYYNEFPQGRLKWDEVSREAASKVPLAMDKGVQCVCIFTGTRGTK